MLTEQEKKLIEKEFKSIDNFIMFYRDLALYNDNTQGIDIQFDLTPFSSNGITTGIMALVNYNADEDIMNVDMVCQNAHRYFKVDDCYKDQILEIRADLKKSDDERDNDNFEFLIPKPFLLKVENNVITYLKPMSFENYETYAPILEKLLEDN